MAVDIGKSVISSATNKVFRKVAGNVNAAITNAVAKPNTSDSARIDRQSSQYSTQNYQFPLDVESGVELGNHGHYIMFYINEQETAKLRINENDEVVGKGIKSVEKEVQSRGIKEQVAEQLTTDLSGGSALQDAARKALVAGGYISDDEDKVPTPQKRKYQSANFERRPTRRLSTAIALYMPPNIQTTYGAEYTDTEVGQITEESMNLFNQLMSAGEGGDSKALKSLTDGVANMLRRTQLKTAGALPGLQGLEEAESFRAGRIISNRMELAFKGVAKRQFQYTFKMIPKSQREAEEIRKIVTAFKGNMLPEFLGDDQRGRQLTIPNTFDIEYMYNGQHNSYLHKISTCFLENMSVTYGGERYTTYADAGDGAPPTETSITLNFKEIETMTRERILEGY